MIFLATKQRVRAPHFLALIRIPALTTFLLLLSFMFFSGYALGSTIEILFQEKGLIAGDRILLGEIASVTLDGERNEALEQSPVAITPKLGEIHTLEPQNVISFLQTTLVADTIKWQGPKSIQVQRDGFIIDKARIQEILSTYIGQNLNRFPAGDIRLVSLRPPPTFVLPKGKLSYEVTPSKPEIIGSSSFAIIFRVDDKIVKNTSVGGRIEIHAEVVTAAVKLTRGMPITSEHISMVKQNITRLREPFFSPNDVIGMRAKKTISSGRIISKHHVEPLPLINKGEVVKILANKGRLSLSVLGIAGKDGLPGEMIQVRNINSRKLVYCRVYAPGIVTVEF